MGFIPECLLMMMMMMVMIYFLTSFDRGHIHDESWDWVGRHLGTAVNRTEGRQKKPGELTLSHSSALSKGVQELLPHGQKTGTRSMQPVRSVPLGGPVVS